MNKQFTKSLILSLALVAALANISVSRADQQPAEQQAPRTQETSPDDIAKKEWCHDIFRNVCTPVYDYYGNYRMVCERVYSHTVCY